jgi:hypothetical protein
MIARMNCVHDFALHIPLSTTSLLTIPLGVQGSLLGTEAGVTVSSQPSICS